MKAVITICSKTKDSQPGLLPAQDRYASTHIKVARTIAQESGLPFYILSGRYGLINGSTPIENYDYYLAEQTDELTDLVTAQLSAEGISEIRFYQINDLNWVPYIKTLHKASQRANVPVLGMFLPATA